MEEPAAEKLLDSPPVTFTLSGYKPLVISAAVLVALVLCAGLNTEPTPLAWTSYARWGAPNAMNIWNGAVWGLVTSSFVHLAIWHLGFNLYWFWIFGRKIEFECGWGFTLFLLLTAAFVSSVAELTFASTTGIGLSGVGYALFGFIWVSARFDARFRGFLTTRITRLFLLWLFVCIVLTVSKIWVIGNAAHLAGLACGSTVAWLQTRRLAWRYGLVAIGLAVVSVPVVWAPWSVLWLSSRAYALQVAGRLPEAKYFYSLILAKEPTSRFAHQNLNGILAFELSKQAVQAFKLGNLAEGNRICQQILRLDPANDWALAMTRARVSAPKSFK